MSKEARIQRSIGAFYNRTLGKRLPRQHFFAMLFLPLLNTFFYYISSAIVGDSARGSLALPIDAQIPLIEEFIIVYFGCYLFWFGGLFFMACQSTERFFGFFARVLVCLIIAFSCFVFLPLEIARATVIDEGFFGDAVRFLYRIDKPYNLFPSLHCFFNWIIYVQIRGKKEYPLALRLFSCIFSLAVFASTLFTRQHFILDVLAGFVLAEASALLLKTPLPRLSRKFFEKIDLYIFTKQK
ncbi:MAG: hypothetical protein E7609_03535 [Ruminococcaceae bacterium]|nr:hypothetical protein [Oscillospiraceae bacterium]